MKQSTFYWARYGIGILCLLVTGLSGFAQVREAWTAHYSDTIRDAAARDLAIDTQGYIYVTGLARSSLTGGDDYTTIKYTPSGQILWVARYNGTGNGADAATAITLDTQGNVYVTGSSRGIDTHVDFATVKYDGATGEQLWAARYAAPDNVPDYAIALALDEAGDVCVAGYSGYTDGAGANSDYVTVKYEGQTGQQLWMSRYNGPGNGVDIVTGMTIDAAGNVFVTGSSRGAGTSADYATIKYDGATGQLLWLARYNGPGNRNDSASALVVNRAGDVYVTGSSSSSNVFTDYATIKYDGQTGQPLWLRRYGGFEMYDAYFASAIALDGAGDLIVTGTNEGGVTFLAATVKYDGQTGQELWVRNLSFNPLSPEVLPADIVVDSERNVYLTGWLGPSLLYYEHDPWSTDTVTVRYDADGYERWVALSYGSFAERLALDEEGNIYVTGGVATVPTQEASPVIYQTIKYEQSPPGDVNLDFCVDDSDLLAVLFAFWQTGNLPEDVNRDGVVDDADLLIVLFNFGRGCGVD